ncbi:MAG: (E)-4-hydroxy-3-methylbut-2-enyl-diphosphate synthase [Bacteroidales bacterium]|nr:(E)-4-hydroxy-3-methylbut-2-enyl-diphosphate synthase [Bacteroidales bacterium]
MNYCEDYSKYKRYPTLEVKVGSLVIGGEQPIVVQSMVNTSTMDTDKTVAQVKELVEAGCELVRITAPGKKEAENLANIKQTLKELGITVPLVADIHFAPKAADIAAEIVEKVRINPGNYVDKKVFKSHDYTDESYAEELKRIEATFIPFLELCRKHGTAIRVGSNHGSLSDRIVNRYGNTPEGMVEAAMEFLRICKQQNFANVVVSMKASNTQVMTHSTRLLAAKMKEEKMQFPIHLGVTEAGNGEDARIKSAIGIGALLADGIGDTIRVSLTEHPKAELPVARTIIEHFSLANTVNLPAVSDVDYSPYQYQKRKSTDYKFIGGNTKPIVVGRVNEHLHADVIFQESMPEHIDKQKSYLVPWENYSSKEQVFPLMSMDEYFIHRPNSKAWVQLEISQIDLLEQIDSNAEITFVFNATSLHAVAEIRTFFFKLANLNLNQPTVIRRHFKIGKNLEIHAACDFGPSLVDGYGDGIWLETEHSTTNAASIALNILQGARVRMSKTEFISCPSCGRTLFDLETTTDKIKSRLSHLKSLKIGVMGCIVNGPGEMADADYGYVGAGKGMVSLYKGQDVIRRNIPSEEAVDELIAIIKEHGDWVEP